MVQGDERTRCRYHRRVLGSHPVTDKTIRVLIIEDHQIVADGLTALLNDQRDMTVVGNVGSVAESAPAASELSPDVVLVDFRLNDGTGADAAAAIRRVNPSARHIFLTREDSDVARFAALESGASGFIHKSKAASEVVDAIRKVASGGTLITPTAIAALLNRRRESESQRESLTAREKEVSSGAWAPSSACTPRCRRSSRPESWR
ncbi:MAG: response regulator transcription factor [Chloroflexi bacterium]|nr:MAG: response regulator transcription factor [Chloroflexota bacterium]